MESYQPPIQLQLPPRTQSERTLVHPKLWFEWAADGKVAILDIVTFDNEAIDAWAAAMKALRDSWDPNEPLLILHMTTLVRFTPYLRQRAEEVIQSTAHLPGAYAFVLGDRAFGQIIRLFLTASQIVAKSSRPGRTFITREDAIAWLLSNIG